jgi:hypothetical protein
VCWQWPHRDSASQLLESVSDLIADLVLFVGGEVRFGCVAQNCQF